MKFNVLQILGEQCWDSACIFMLRKRWLLHIKEEALLFFQIAPNGFNDRTRVENKGLNTTKSAWQWQKMAFIFEGTKLACFKGSSCCWEYTGNRTLKSALQLLSWEKLYNSSNLLRKMVSVVTNTDSRLLLFFQGEHHKSKRFKTIRKIQCMAF